MVNTYEVTQRIYLTSDKRVVVPEGDERARFLLAAKGPVNKATAEQIQAYKGGKQYVRGPDSPKAKSRKPKADKSRKPEADKSGQVEGDNEDQAEGGTEGSPGETAPAALGPDDPMPDGTLHAGTLVRDLPDRYLKNLQRLAPNYRPMVEAELARREANPGT